MAGMQVLGTTCELLIAPEFFCLWEDRKEGEPVLLCREILCQSSNIEKTTKCCLLE